jgi:hypothetical protein
MSRNRAALYLQIPADYCRSFGGLRWAQYGEAVEFLDGPAAGRTFAFAAEIALFLEGLQTAGSCGLNFGFVLHLLYLIGLSDRGAPAGDSSGRSLERIAAPFRALGCPLRNCGAFCAWLCREAPRAAAPPDLAGLYEILTGGSWVPQIVLSHPMLGARDQSEEPALDSDEFEALVRRALEAVSDEEIRHWLRHGRGPAGVPDDRLLPIRPRALVGTLSELETRPRLSGMARLASRLEGALCLPPRRLAFSELQNGGYADLTTRGAPEQILPIQLAFEREEFLRRFAERELLYFQREEPRQPTTEELLVLFDQGVRTWGDVRLVLASAAVALLRQADRRRIVVKLAATSNDGEPVDAATIDPGAFSALLEASDLSPHPGRALAHVLKAPDATRRDVVLLTHPRSLLEPEVAAAATAGPTNPNTRLFAVSVDSAGHVELSELRRGRPVVLGRSRVDVAAESAGGSPAPGLPVLAPVAAWNGEVEPAGFPFRCGVLDYFDSPYDDGLRHFDFDEAGQRILAIGCSGLLFCWRIDETEGEILPRPVVEGEVLRPLRTVIGVAGGFVLLGCRKDRLILAHYHFPTRTCTLHAVEHANLSDSWFYYRDLHALAYRATTGTRPSGAVDLAASRSRAALTARAKRAAARADSEFLWSDNLGIRESTPHHRESYNDISTSSIRLDATTGTLHYRDWRGDSRKLTPQLDGRPALAGGRLLRARPGDDVLAVLVGDAAAPGLYFISVSRAAVIGIFTPGNDSLARSFALARDGRRFARLLGDRQLEVRDVPGDRPPVFVTSQVEKIWIHFAMLARSCLLVRELDTSGPRRVRSRVLIRWDQGRLQTVYRAADAGEKELPGTVAVSRSLSPPLLGAGYDPQRFVQHVERDGLRILIDRYNHLVVLDRSGNLICMLYVNRDEVAAWLPDGTCWGSRRLTGREQADAAAERIAAVLCAAETGQGSSS